MEAQVLPDQTVTSAKWYFKIRQCKICLHSFLLVLFCYKLLQCTFVEILLQVVILLKIRETVQRMYSGTTNEFCLLLFVFSCAPSAYSKSQKNIKKWRINEPITYSESASLWWKYFDAEKVRYTEVLVSSEIPEVLFVKLTIQSFTEIIIFLTGSCWS